jgi:hypothetical protein
VRGDDRRDQLRDADDAERRHLQQHLARGWRRHSATRALRDSRRSPVR